MGQTLFVLSSCQMKARDWNRLSQNRLSQTYFTILSSWTSQNNHPRTLRRPSSVKPWVLGILILWFGFRIKPIFLLIVWQCPIRLPILFNFYTISWSTDSNQIFVSAVGFEPTTKDHGTVVWFVCPYHLARGLSRFSLTVFSSPFSRSSNIKHITSAHTTMLIISSLLSVSLVFMISKV